MSGDLFAYLDPGTGSVILQAIIGGVAAVAVTARLWWHRATSLFRRDNHEGLASGEEKESTADPR